MAGHNSGRARTFCFSEGVNGFFAAANCDFYFPLSHWIPQRSLSQVASDRLQSFFVHHAVACFFELSRLEFTFQGYCNELRRLVTSLPRRFCQFYDLSSDPLRTTSKRDRNAQEGCRN